MSKTHKSYYLDLSVFGHNQPNFNSILILNLYFLYLNFKSCNVINNNKFNLFCPQLFIHLTYFTKCSILETSLNNSDK